MSHVPSSVSAQPSVSSSSFSCTRVNLVKSRLLTQFKLINKERCEADPQLLDALLTAQEKSTSLRNADALESFLRQILKTNDALK